jgi:putative Mg2+ transporter-C (MgtC) family protein
MSPSLLEVISGEFSDLTDVAGFVRVALRLSVASLLGGILGWDREQAGKAAGLRTHMLVAVGAAMFVLVPQQAGASQADLSRVIQGLAAGIGFLGAGAIIKRKDESHIQGLTTAAGIWMTAAIGVSAGLGREATAIVSTLLALAILTLVPWIEHWFGKPATHANGQPHDSSHADE